MTTTERARSATMTLDRARRIADSIARNADLTTTEVQALRALIEAAEENTR